MAGKDAILARRRPSANAQVLNTLAQTDKKTLFLRLDQLVARPDNRPINEAAVEELAASIEQDGLGQPVLARSIEGDPDHYELIGGQHRCAAYKLLAKRHPQDPQYKTIECAVRFNMDDASARRLMLATNVIGAAVEVADKAWMLDELEKDIPALRAENPDLRGKRTNEILADMITDAGGQTVSPATVKRMKREVKATKTAQTLTLIELWQDEVKAKTIKPAIYALIAQFDLARQQELFERWEDHERSKTWLATEVELERGRAQDVMSRAYKAINDAAGLVRRAHAAGADSEDVKLLLQSVLNDLEKGR